MVGLELVIFAALSLAVLGFYFRKGKSVGSFKNVLRSCMYSAFLVLIVGFFLVITPQAGMAADVAASGAGWGFLGAAIAAGLGCLGAGIAVAVVGSSALGVVGEKPEMLGSTLIYLGLAEGIAIYGLIVALLILGRM